VTEWEHGKEHRRIGRRENVSSAPLQNNWKNDSAIRTSDDARTPPAGRKRNPRSVSKKRWS